MNFDSGGGGGGALKWPLKGGSRLIEVAATAGLTVLICFFNLLANAKVCMKS